VQTNIKNREVLKAGETEPRGGWKPNDDAADTLSRGSGTSADLTILFLSLLRADGWKSRVVYTADREYRYFRPEIPSVFQLSGIVVEISDARLKNPMYASFEHPMLPFGLLPWNRIGVTGWAVDLEKKSGTAQPIPGPPAEQSAVHTVWKIRMDENGDGRVERARRMSGLRAFEIRAPIWSEGLDTWEKQAREGYPKDPIPGELESLRFENLEAPEKELLDTAISMRKGLGASLPGFRLTVTPVRLAAMRNVFVKSSRDESIQFPFPFVYEDAFEIEAPEGFAPDTLPDPAERKTAAGIYRISAEKGEGARITVRRRFELLRPSGGREMYGAFRTLFETAEREDEGYTVVFRKPAPAGGKKP
jgi:hypothetical protein